MRRVIDLECYAPAELSDPDYHAIERGRPGTPFPDALEPLRDTASPTTSTSFRDLRPRVLMGKRPRTTAE